MLQCIIENQNLLHTWFYRFHVSMTLDNIGNAESVLQTEKKTFLEILGSPPFYLSMGSPLAEVLALYAQSFA